MSARSPLPPARDAESRTLAPVERGDRSPAIAIRRATVADVPAMHEIIRDAAEYGLMLPRPLAMLYENVREFVVAEEHESSEAVDPQADAGPSLGRSAVVGVCGLSIVWADLAEVASLVVRPRMRGLGLGKRLVRACLDEARELGIRRVMTLTYEQAFFEKLGFAVVDRQKLPLKVWSECVRCPKNQACDEIAMLIEYNDLPVLAAPAPQRPSEDSYIVPVTLRRTQPSGTRGS